MANNPEDLFGTSEEETFLHNIDALFREHDERIGRDVNPETLATTKVLAGTLNIADSFLDVQIWEYTFPESDSGQLEVYVGPVRVIYNPKTGHFENRLNGNIKTNVNLIPLISWINATEWDAQFSQALIIGRGEDRQPEV